MISKELIGASARPFVLTILNRQETYGYAIIRRMNELSEGDISWKEGMLYPVLHRLEDEKIITSRWRITERGRKRKYYRLTTKGKRSLEAERNQWMRVDTILQGMWAMDPDSAT